MKPRNRNLAPLLWSIAALCTGALTVAWVIETRYGVSLEPSSFRFERPWAGLLVLLAPVALAARGYWLERRAPRLLVSRGADLALANPGWRVRFRHLTTGLRVTALTLLAMALMGPQSIHAKDQAEVDGIDIMLTLDLSLSMQAADIRPNRFEAAKHVVGDFIQRRPNDRIGAVIFGREAYTLLPLTTDTEALHNMIDELELEAIDGRGTAIGNAVATSLNRLRGSKAKSKVVILLTDGNSNSGNVAPEQAAEFAKVMGVKVFTVLMGRSDDAPVQTGTDLFGSPVYDRGNYPVDPELLRKMAVTTGGEAFRVTDREGLIRTFHTILDRLQKTEVQDAGRVYGELFPAFVWPALAALLCEALVGLFLLRRWP